MANLTNLATKSIIIDKICCLGDFMFYQFQHYGISEEFCKEYGKDFSYPIHLHHAFEFITITEGEMKVTVDNHTYTLTSGKSVIIFPNQIHSLSSEKSKHMLCIFSPELVKAYTTVISEKTPAENTFTPNRYLIEALDKISPDSSSIEKKGVLYSLCGEFDKNARYKSKDNFDDNLLFRIFDFVEKNYTEECGLSQLAKNTGYSYSYLSKCFKKSTGISFNNYVNQYRINKACYLLSNSENSILQCALESGYKSLRSFNRNFADYMKTTPKEYKNQNGM